MPRKATEQEIRDRLSVFDGVDAFLLDQHWETKGEEDWAESLRQLLWKNRMKLREQLDRLTNDHRTNMDRQPRRPDG